MDIRRKTKIVATIGPASWSPVMLPRLLDEGVDVARLNFSHGTHEEHGRVLHAIRDYEKKTGRIITIVADLQGPKMRVGKMPEGGLLLREGDEVVLDTSISTFAGKDIPVPSPIFRDGIRKGGDVLLDDGSLLLKVTRVNGNKVSARVVRGGTLRSYKGINAPTLELRRSIFEEKDKRDMAFAKKEGADYIALSFLRDAHDVMVARKLLGNSKAGIIAKIERPEALEHLDEIIDAADAIMVARGDLGIETPLWNLPVRQKEIVERARAKMKPVIVATQMLESMINNPVPTRAEVSDVANAVYDHADAVMLSAESASGRYPLEAVRMMRHILEETEGHVPDIEVNDAHPITINRSIAKSTKRIATEIGAKVILSAARTGFTSRAVARHRPGTPIIAFTADVHIARALGLVWGITPLMVQKGKTLDAVYATTAGVIKQLLRAKVLTHGDRAVFLSEQDIKGIGLTNRLSVFTIS